MNKLTAEQTLTISRLLEVEQGLIDLNEQIAKYRDKVRELETEEAKLKIVLYPIVSAMPNNTMFVQISTDRLLQFTCQYDKLYYYHRPMFLQTK